MLNDVGNGRIDDFKKDSIENDESKKGSTDYPEQILGGIKVFSMNDLCDVKWHPNDEADAESNDQVNHPSHYETNGIECFDAIVASQGVEVAKSFCICNAMKYIWRHSHKNGLEDIKKTVWYLNKYIELTEND